MFAQRNIFTAAVVLLCLTCFSVPALASVGDRLPEFKACVNQCTYKQCTSDRTVLPLSLRLLFWTCPQNCDYICQKLATMSRINEGLPIEQFHGKWPFDRYMGIQEPASVFFSILNFLPHYYGLKMVKSLTSSSDTRTLSPFFVNVYKGFAFVGMNAWIWSSVFHVRDFVLTERLDYFSAGLTVTYGFFTAAVRTFRLDDPKKIAYRYALIAICLTAYISHVSYLQFVKFSYSYNMLANVIVGALQNVLWIYQSISSYRKAVATSAPNVDNVWKLWPMCIVLTITGAMSLELFDFPPLWNVLDAHALWHAGTVLPTIWYYAYLKRDIIYLKNSKQKD